MNAGVRKRRELILLAVRDMVTDFLVRQDQIGEAVSIGEPAIWEIVRTFEEALREGIAPQPVKVTAYMIQSRGE